MYLTSFSINFFNVLRLYKISFLIVMYYKQYDVMRSNNYIFERIKRFMQDTL